MARAELPAIANRHRQFGIRHLRRGLTAQLPRGFEEQKNTALPRMVRGQTAAIRVDGQSGLIKGEVAIADERATNPFLQ